MCFLLLDYLCTLHFAVQQRPDAVAVVPELLVGPDVLAAAVDVDVDERLHPAGPRRQDGDPLPR